MSTFSEHLGNITRILCVLWEYCVASLSHAHMGGFRHYLEKTPWEF